jgi:tryptophan-rich sensory protein
MTDGALSTKAIGRTALVTVPLIVGVGFLMGQLSDSGYGNGWFDALAKPSAMPPGWAFGLAWTILYVLLGAASAIIWNAPSSGARSAGLALFLIQLLLNFSWSPLFFGAHQILWALGVIVVMLGLSIATTANFAKTSKVAAGLMIPYLAWLAFATYLNFEILQLNPGA